MDSPTPIQDFVRPATQVGDGASGNARVERAPGDLLHLAVQAENRRHQERLQIRVQVREVGRWFHGAGELFSHQTR